MSSRFGLVVVVLSVVLAGIYGAKAEETSAPSRLRNPSQGRGFQSVCHMLMDSVMSPTLLLIRSKLKGIPILMMLEFR